MSNKEIDSIYKKHYSRLGYVLEIIRDYGMPTVAFGVGIYFFITVMLMPMATEIKAIVALAFTFIGLASQLWLYSRENPKIHSNEVNDQLERMTKLVEKMIDNKRDS